MDVLLLLIQLAPLVVAIYTITMAVRAYVHMRREQERQSACRAQGGNLPHGCNGQSDGVAAAETGMEASGTVGTRSNDDDACVNKTDVGFVFAAKFPMPVAQCPMPVAQSCSPAA